LKLQIVLRSPLLLFSQPDRFNRLNVRQLLNPFGSSNLLRGNNLIAERLPLTQ